MKKLTIFHFIFIGISCSIANAEWKWADKPKTDIPDLVGNSKISSLRTTKEGITYATGNFVQKATFQNYVLTAVNAPNPNPFVIKYDTNGNVLWACGLPVSIAGSANSIAIDQEENVYITGTFTGQINFAPLVFVQTSFPNSLFLAKYNKNGVFLWAKMARTLTPNGIALDKDGGIYIAGSFSGSQAIGNVFLQSLGNYDAFIVKYDSLGKFLWAKNFGTEGYDTANAIAIDSNGDTYVTGGVSKGNVQFGLKSIDNTQGNWRSVFLAKFDLNGLLKWGRIESSVVPNSSIVSDGYGVACDEFNACYITGSFNFNLNLQILYGVQTPNIQLLANDDKDIFVIKYSSEGIVQWARKAGGSSSVANSDLLIDDEGLAITIDKSGNNRLLITGYFESDCHFDNLQLSNTGDKDVFVASYNRNTGQLAYVKAVGADDTSSQAIGYSISTDAWNSFYLGGRFNTDSQSAIHFGQISLTANEGLYDAYVAKYFNLFLVNIEKPTVKFFGQ